MVEESKAEILLKRLAAGNMLHRRGAKPVTLMGYNMADYVATITACVDHPEWARWWYQEFQKMDFINPDHVRMASEGLIAALTIESELVGVGNE